MKVKLYLLGWVIMICSVISAKGQSLKVVVAQAETGQPMFTCLLIPCLPVF